MLLFISLASLPSSIVPLVDTAVFSSRFKISFINCTNSPLLSLADCTNAVLLSLIVCIPFYFVRIRLIFNGRCRISMKSDRNLSDLPVGLNHLGVSFSLLILVASAIGTWYWHWVVGSKKERIYKRIHSYLYTSKAKKAKHFTINMSHSYTMTSRTYPDLSIRLSVFGHNFAAYGPHY